MKKYQIQKATYWKIPLHDLLEKKIIEMENINGCQNLGLEEEADFKGEISEDFYDDGTGLYGIMMVAT